MGERTRIMDIEKVGEARVDVRDELAIEEPLQVRLTYASGKGVVTRTLSVTMRTPGHDEELALGFLLAEGVILYRRDVDAVLVAHNAVTVALRAGLAVDLAPLERNFMSSSSCGVCGKTHIETRGGITPHADTSAPGTGPFVSAAQLHALPTRLRDAQEAFAATGGIHASAIFNAAGEIVTLREDVGRHNALDKAIGYAFSAGLLPLDGHSLLLSGRVSFELVQKAAAAGIRVIAAIGAPSTLAVDLCRDLHLTLIGFLREGRFNVYSGGWRIR